jgi:hypothetical protein
MQKFARNAVAAAKANGVRLDRSCFQELKLRQKLKFVVLRAHP